MTIIEQRQSEVLKIFEPLKDWDSKYKKIIEMGKRLEAYPEQYRTEDNKVKGCQSQVWLYAELDSDQKIKLYADSDALIVKGLVALLLIVYSKSSPDDILSAKPDYIRELGLSSHLTPSRSNGLNAMLKQIHNYALAFKYLQESKKKL